MADDGNTEGLVELDIDNQEEFNRIVMLYFDSREQNLA